MRNKYNNDNLKKLKKSSTNRHTIDKDMVISVKVDVTPLYKDALLEKLQGLDECVKDFINIGKLKILIDENNDVNRLNNISRDLDILSKLAKVLNRDEFITVLDKYNTSFNLNELFLKETIDIFSILDLSEDSRDVAKIISVLTSKSLKELYLNAMEYSLTKKLKSKYE